MATALNLTGASAIEASCFNATTEEAYDDLRATKTAATTKIKEIVKMYEELKDKDAEDIENVDLADRIVVR